MKKSISKQTKLFNNDGFKIIYTILIVDMLGFCVDKEGIFKILKGFLDLETLPFKEIATFGSRVSITQRKISKYLKEALNEKMIYDKQVIGSNQIYFYSNEKSKEFIDNFLMNKSVNFKKRIIKNHYNFIKK